MVRSVVFGTNSSEDFFYDDDDLENMAVTHPSRDRRTTENTSHYFKNSAPAQRVEPFPLMSQRGDMEGCDDFSRAKADECYQNLIRLRNDVQSLLQ